jgi:outer membrane protein OmpA-like peptidoglycan-associated protein
MMANRKLLLTVVVLLAGCGSTPPPRALLDARAAYRSAQSSHAATLVPAELYEAKVALNAAEQSFLDEGDSEKTFALSYVAQRTSQLVVAQANIKAAEAQRDKANEEVNQLQGESLRLAHGQLSRTKQELALKEQKLAVKDKQLAKTSQELEAEKKARAEAERRMREALQRVAEAAALAVKQEPRGTVIVLPGNVLFESGKWTLKPLAQQKIALVAEQIRTQPESIVTVEGHTDSRGTESSNQVLSQNRAESVRNFLISKGIPAKQIRAMGLGESRPVASNETPEGRANNRRVEIIVKQGEPR